jgi:hypothetical protein
MTSLLDHLAAAAEHELTVTTVDGKLLIKGKLDHVFTDGLSLVVRNGKQYFPLTGITSIVVHPLKAPRPKEAKKRTLADLLPH